jgi:carboxyl-terminal processing protease
MNIGFPDVCLTPAAPAPIPVPYPNLGMNAQAQAFSTTVKVSGVNALNLGSMISMTTGDEAGSAHPTIKGMGKYTMGNPIVFIDKLPAINLALPTTGNMMNNGLGLVAVPSAVNVMFCLANDGAAEVGSSELSQLAESMLRPEVEAELLPNGVIRLRPSCFGTGMRSAFARALQPFSSAEARALIVDLRGCPGGDLIEAAYLAADFLPTGQAHVDLDCGGEQEVISVEASARWGMPLWVLIDRTSASAAEVFAAIVQSAGRARLVGERSYGKGSVQRVVTGADQSLRADVATWSVAGRPGSAGVLPDVELAAPAADADLWLKTAWALSLR